MVNNYLHRRGASSPKIFLLAAGSRWKPIGLLATFNMLDNNAAHQCCLSLLPVAGMDRRERVWERVWAGYGYDGLGLPETAKTGDRRVIADGLNSGDRDVIVRRRGKKRCCDIGLRGMVGISIFS